MLASPSATPQQQGNWAGGKEKDVEVESEEDDGKVVDLGGDELEVLDLEDDAALVEEEVS